MGAKPPPLAAAPSRSIWRGPHPSPLPLAQPSPLQLHLLLGSAWRSPAGELQAPPPRCRAARALPQLFLSPCWIKKEVTYLGCTCVKRGGAVRLALDRIFRDLNRREYDSLITILLNASVRDLQRYVDASNHSLLDELLYDLGETSRKIFLFCNVPQQPGPW